MTKQLFEFVLALNRELTGTEARTLHYAGFDDSDIGSVQGKGYIQVAWRAPTRDEAMSQAITTLKHAIPGLRVVDIAECVAM